jgi:5-methylcytosine-specific restriction endonuclease McrA
MRPRPVLLLNQNYAPLNVCPTPRALSLVDRGRAEVLEYGEAPIAATTRLVDSPSVIRLRHFVRTPPLRLAVTRDGVHVRDGRTCQYCGAQPKRVTLDHVRPVCQGGRFVWANLVTACGPCNHRKGGRTPEQAGMRLRRQPFEPRAIVTPRVARYLGDRRFDGWLKFVPLAPSAGA